MKGMKYPSRGFETLKAFVTSSPGFALKPWGKECQKLLVVTLKGLRRFSRLPNRQCNPFRVASFY